MRVISFEEEIKIVFGQLTDCPLPEILPNILSLDFISEMVIHQ
jgi:hypothetical protein